MLLDTFSQHVVDGAQDELENHDGLWIGSGGYENNGDWGAGARSQNGLVVPCAEDCSPTGAEDGSGEYENNDGLTGFAKAFTGAWGWGCEE